MRLTVSSARPEINWNAQYEERLAQDVANLIRCYMSEVPYYRNMGVDGSLLHKPLPEAKEELKGQIEEMLEEYAEDVTVDAVRVLLDHETKETVIEVDLSDGEEEGTDD